MHYSQRLLKYSASHSADEIAVKVRRHSARQTLFRNIKSRRGMEKLLYRKVFVKSKLKKNMVMFECFFGRNYSDSPKYIFEYLAKNYPDEYQFVWVVAKRTKIPYKAKTVKRFSLRYFYYMAKAGYFVFNVRQPNWFIKRDGVKFLETWHGTPLKKLAFDQEEVTSASPMYKKNTYIGSRNWDYLIAPNKFSSDIFKQCFMFDKTMLETGYPRNDILYSKGEERDRLVHEIKDELGLPKDKKVILYAPTWRDDEFSEDDKYEFRPKISFEKLQEELGDEYIMIVKYHYLIMDAVDWTPYEGFVYHFDQSRDIAELFLVADLLVTDYSSVMFDYSILKRPMFFFAYDFYKYKNELRGFYFSYRKEMPGPISSTTEELIRDIGKGYQEVIRQFYEAGCRNLQLDDCTWGAIVGEAAKQRYKSLGIDLEEVKAQLLEVNNLALEGKPEDMVITSHICRGNYHSTFFTSGPYDSVADYVFAKEKVDALFLEYDDERSGGFAPLAKVSADKKVVLGLITTKSPVLEDKKTVIARIHEAAKYVPLDRLCLSPQCGFASCEIGNKLTEDEQWAKLKLVKEIAEEVW